MNTCRTSKITRVFLTKEIARNKILEFMNQAESKAKRIESLIRSLEKEEDFFIDYTIDGDTHGIHEEHLDINFKLGGFHFNFIIDVN